MKKSELEGYALCRALIKGRVQIISTFIRVPCVVIDDWQYDEGWHDVGWIEYDLKKAYPKNNKEYKIILVTGEVIQGTDKIKKIIEVIEKKYLSERF